MFRQARIKLTLWYILILMVVSTLFSVVIYRMLTLEVTRFAELQKTRIERRFVNEKILIRVDPSGRPIPELALMDPDLVKEVKTRIAFILIGINGVIFIVAGGLSYILAGKTLSPIQKMLEEQNRFIADASHELRTPLTAIKTSFEVLLRNKKVGVEEARTVIKDSMADVESLQRLTDSLLELASSPTPQTIVREPVSLKEIIGQSMHQVHPSAEKKHIQLMPVSTDIDVLADRLALIELFSIILDNAVKYGKPNTEVVTDVTEKGRRVIVKIKDQGIGIEEKNLSHIFDRFYRADEARTRNGHDGYGLGLSIARQIVNQHKGSITAKSTKGKGTTMIVELPVARDNG